MKKTLIIAIAILITGLVSSCSKDNAVSPTVIKTQQTVSDKGDLGTGDGN